MATKRPKKWLKGEQEEEATNRERKKDVKKEKKKENKRVGRKLLPLLSLVGLRGFRVVGEGDGGDVGNGAGDGGGGEACFADELLLLELTSGPCHPSVAELKHQAQILQEFFEPCVEGLPGLPTEGKGGGDEEEEELEWLANKDAFPALETSFERPSRPRAGSGGSEGWDGAAVGAVAERKSPVSVLSAATSFSAPVRPRSKGRRPRRRVLTGLSPEPPTVTVAGKSTAVERRRCRHCEAEETPQWRAGPEGPKTLCNACGVRYKSGRLVPEYRPASSPTFSPANHSNFHRQILEMRRQRSPRQRRSAGAPPPRPLVNSPVM